MLKLSGICYFFLILVNESITYKFIQKDPIIVRHTMTTTKPRKRKCQEPENESEQDMEKKLIPENSENNKRKSTKHNHEKESAKIWRMNRHNKSRKK